MDHHLKSASLPILSDSNFKQWKQQSLMLVVCTLSVEESLEKDIVPKKLSGDEKKNFFTFTNLMLLSLSKCPLSHRSWFQNTQGHCPLLDVGLPEEALHPRDVIQ